MNGAQPPMCSMWVPAVPCPPPLPYLSLSLSYTHTLSPSASMALTLSSALTLFHTIITLTKLIHSLTGNVLYKFVLELCYLFIVLCYILGMFIFIIIFC